MLDSAEIKRPPRRLSPEEKAEFERRFNEGESATSLAAWLGCTEYAIVIRGYRMNLPSRAQDRYIRAQYGVTNNDARLRREYRRRQETPLEHDSNRARFVGIRPQPDRVRPLAADHPAIVEGRTLFPTSVVSARDTPRLLVSGRNNRKIGAEVEKGAWAGMPIYVLTLEERATCSRSCFMYRRCYGNAMHLARRHQHGAEFERRLRAELTMMGYEHPQGFVVRLHVLGDFYSRGYVELWAEMLAEVPQLHVYGYTARDPSSSDEEDAQIGHAIRVLKWQERDRFRIRWSRRLPVEDGATVIDYFPDETNVREGLVCPAEREATAACATCGMCWSHAIPTIVFVQHGPLMGSAEGSP